MKFMAKPHELAVLRPTVAEDGVGARSSPALSAPVAAFPTCPGHSAPLSAAFHRGADPVSANTEMSLSLLNILWDAVGNETMLSSHFLLFMQFLSPPFSEITSDFKGFCIGQLTAGSHRSLCEMQEHLPSFILGSCKYQLSWASPEP